MSLCSDCSRAVSPWSEELKARGWIGCAYYELQSDLSADEFYSHGNASEAGAGWITAGGIMHNFCLLTRETTRCEFYRKAEGRTP